MIIASSVTVGAEVEYTASGPQFCEKFHQPYSLSLSLYTMQNINTDLHIKIYTCIMGKP